MLGALLLAIAVTACGDDREEEAAEVEDVAVAYGASEGTEGCEFLSASALDQIGGESGCTRVFEDVPSAELVVEETTVEGDEATVRVCNVDDDNTVELGFVKEDEEWKLSSFPGLDPTRPLPPPEPCDEESGAEETAPDAQELQEEFEQGEE